MKLSSLLIALVTVSAFAGEPPDINESLQSSASFEAAIRNNSTSPSYVQIKVVDTRDGSTRSMCTTGNLLIGAILLENGLAMNSANDLKAVEIAAANHNRKFRFGKQEALNNIPVKYSDSDLAAARDLFAFSSTDELRTEFSSLYKRSISIPNNTPRDAIACALIERGLSPELSDRSGQIFVPSLPGHP